MAAVTPVCDCCTQKSQEITHRNKAERMKSIPKLKSKDGGTPDSKHKIYMYQQFCGGTYRYFANTFYLIN